MSLNQEFKHLSLVLKKSGTANLRYGGGKQSEQTQDNKKNYIQHSQTISNSIKKVTTNWQTKLKSREQKKQPPVPNGIPLLLKIATDLDVDMLGYHFGFEVLSEQEDGFVIVASDDIDLKKILTKVNDFAQQKRGLATVAAVHRFFEDSSQEERLCRILSKDLFKNWYELSDKQLYIVDVSIYGIGNQLMPNVPKKPIRSNKNTDTQWERRINPKFRRFFCAKNYCKTGCMIFRSVLHGYTCYRGVGFVSLYKLSTCFNNAS
jgi:hypothetical protein